MKKIHTYTTIFLHHVAAAQTFSQKKKLSHSMGMYGRGKLRKKCDKSKSSEMSFSRVSGCLWKMSFVGFNDDIFCQLSLLCRCRSFGFLIFCRSFFLKCICIFYLFCLAFLWFRAFLSFHSCFILFHLESFLGECLGNSYVVEKNWGVGMNFYHFFRLEKNWEVKIIFHSWIDFGARNSFRLSNPSQVFKK